MVKLICGPKSVEGGSLGAALESLASLVFVRFLAAMSTVLLKKFVPFWRVGGEKAVDEELDVGDPVVDMLRPDMGRWVRTRQ